tara:strand:+ start:485 stop:721 length:237 start_codon:yes stop_codon:yes gene_type:complete
MSVPTFYIVAEGNAYALDIDGIPFGAPVFNDGQIDWDSSYDFDPCDVEDIEYVAHIIQHLLKVRNLTHEHLNSEVTLK